MASLSIGSWTAAWVLSPSEQRSSVLAGSSSPRRSELKSLLRSGGGWREAFLLIGLEVGGWASHPSSFSNMRVAWMRSPLRKPLLPAEAVEMVCKR